jgi:2-dehydro-3-deoxygluconokinase
MLGAASVAFADARDIALILGGELEGDSSERRRAAAGAAFRAFPRLERICATIRDADNVSRQRLSGVMLTRERELCSRAHALDGIVDRVGAGDAFAAGILHGLVAGYDDQRTLEFAVAAAALKHSVRGDFNPVDLHDVEGLLAGPTADIRR